MRKIILGLVFLILLQGVFALDVAYVLKNSNVKDQNVLDVFDELAYDVYFILDGEAASVDFSQYDVIFVQDDLYSHPEDIPVTDQDSIIINRRNMADWNYNDGWASSLTATQPLEVYTYSHEISEGLPAIFDIYTEAVYYPGSVGIPLYYLHRYDVAPLLRSHIVSYPMEITDPNPQLNGAVFAIPKGTPLLNGDVNDGKTCYFGASESDYWTWEARELFKNCVAWVTACSDMDEDGFSPDGNGCGPIDCDDTNPDVYPGADEICNGIDDDCDTVVDGMEDYCGTGPCEGTTICIEGEWSDCSSYGHDAGVCAICDEEGSVIFDYSQDTGEMVGDCDSNDLDAVAECTFDPDNIDTTYDTHDAVYSECESIGSCSYTEYDIMSFTHECSIDLCGAECNSQNPCGDTLCEQLSGCVGNDYYEYSDVSNLCLDDCACEENLCGAPLIYDNDPRCTECQIDDDCDHFDSDYCSLDLVKHDEGICVDFQCTTETTTVEDCDDLDNNYCDGTEIKNDDYMCEGAVCILDVTTLVEDCDDTLFCNGEESCFEAACVDGADPILDDQVSCTVDSCDEDADTIIHTATDSLCDNGLYCDGEEYCDETLDCQDGVAPVLDDGVSCTDDTCDEDSDQIVHTPVDSYCDNGLYCDGAEYCDETLDCQDGTIVDCSSNDINVDECLYDPDSVDTTHDYYSFSSVCDEDEDECTSAPGDWEDDITHTCDIAQCGAVCEDDLGCGAYCEGDVYYYSGSCDSGCLCDYSTENCNDQDGWYDTTNTQWVDIDQCNEKQQKEQEYREYTCGLEGCEFTVTDTQWVDLGIEQPKADGLSCDDGLFCTVDDQCSVGVCGGSVMDVDDGLFCTDDSCDEDLDVVTHTPVDVDDGVSCTDDSCDDDLDQIVHTPVDSYCDNGLYCDGAEYCDETLDCQDGTAPILDDSVGCTVDSCDEDADQVVHTATDSLCDNGLYCDGAEYCDETLDCQYGTAPVVDDGLFCTDDSCDEDTDTILHDPIDVDDGLFCTDDSCDEDTDTILHDPVDVDDGLFCTVDSCDEAGDVILHDPIDVDDGVACTVDYCDDDVDIIINTPDDSYCDNGLYCDGEEYCDAVLGCQVGTDVDCSGNDLSGIAICTNNPDNIDETWDYRDAFTSSCQEETQGYSCTEGDDTITHECDITQCGAECEDDLDCSDSECDGNDGCYGEIYRDYHDVPNTCNLQSCGCTQNSCDDYDTIFIDNDLDGFSPDGPYFCGDIPDCNDNDPTVYPGAVELPDGIDQNCVNDPPTISASDVIVNEMELVDVDPVVSDVDNPLVDLIITFESPLDSNGEWQTDYDDAGIYPTNVHVSDGDLSDSDSLTITVLNVNRPPVAIIDNPIDGNVYGDADLIGFDGTSSYDPDGDPLAYTWTSNLDGLLGGSPLFTSTLSIGIHVITLEVSDGDLSDTDSVTIEVIDSTPELDFNYTITATGTEDELIYPDEEFNCVVTGTGTEVIDTLEIVHDPYDSGHVQHENGFSSNICSGLGSSACYAEGCTWESESDSLCKGTARECSELGNLICEGQQGCGLSEAYCGVGDSGQGNPGCQYITTKHTCEYVGCTWDEEDEITPCGGGHKFYCSAIDKSNQCNDNTNNKCAWVPVHCEGVATSCEAFGREDICEQQRGCNWETSYSGSCTAPRVCDGSNPCDHWIAFQETTRHTGCRHPVEDTEGGSCLVWEGSWFSINTPYISQDMSCKVKFRGEYGGGTGDNEDAELTIGQQTQIVPDLGQASGQPKIWLVGEFAERFYFTEGYNEMKWRGLGGSLGLDWYRIYDCIREEESHREEPRQATDTCHDTVNKLEGNKFIFNFDAEPQPEEGGYMVGITYEVTDDNPDVNTWILGPAVYASTNVDDTITVPWSDTESGVGSVSAEDGIKYITTSTLVAPNGDTFWGVVDDHPDVHTFMSINPPDEGVNGPRLYATTDFTYNTAPSISGIPDQNIDEDSGVHPNLVDLYPYASDSEQSDSELGFSILSQSNEPLVVCYIDGNRYISCNAPSLNDNGQSIIVVSVTDGEYSDTDTFILTVNPVNDAPVIDPIDDIYVVEGDLVDVDPTANDVDGDSLTFTFSAPLDSNGEWQTVVGDVGEYDVTVGVNDGSLSDSTMFTIYVTALVTECNDGLDNDGDGSIDYPDDFSCDSPLDDDESNPESECQDGIDNDGDDATDYDEDYSCSSLQDNDETNPKAECQDGIDNDLDGHTDYGDDLGCDSLQDNDEGDGAVPCYNNGDCGSINVITSCDVGGNFVTETTTPTCFDPGTEYSYCQDVVNDVGDDCSYICSDSLGCDYTECSDGLDNDLDGDTDYPSDSGCSSYLDDDESDGVVACSSNGECGTPNVINYCDVSGDFVTETTTPICYSPGTEQSYCQDFVDDVVDDCSYICSDSLGCDYTECSDGIDNDLDSYTDYPSDPGCSSYLDDKESNGVPGIPECSDGVDNDGDGLVDLRDPGCSDPEDDDESDGTSECQDGIDNDLDGDIDYPFDQGCENPQDNDESNGVVECDQDSIPNDLDNCPCVSNREQRDSDEDGVGDACDESYDKEIRNVKHDFKIAGVRIYNDYVFPGDDLEVYAYIKNDGNVDEDNIRLMAEIPELGLVERGRIIDTLPSKQGTWSYLTINVPYTTESGYYTLRLSAENTKDRYLLHRWFLVG